MIWNKTKKPQWVHLQYFHLTVYRSTIWLTVWGGTGEGGSGVGPNLEFSLDGQIPSQPPQRKAQAVGRRERGAMPDRRQEESYVQVRPTFHQSKTIHCIICKRLRLNAHFRSQVWCLARCMQTRQLEKLSARWTPTRWPRPREWLPPGESFPETHSIFVLCNTSGLNIGMCFLE